MIGVVNDLFIGPSFIIRRFNSIQRFHIAMIYSQNWSTAQNRLGPSPMMPTRSKFWFGHRSNGHSANRLCLRYTRVPTIAEKVAGCSTFISDQTGFSLQLVWPCTSHMLNHRTHKYYDVLFKFCSTCSPTKQTATGCNQSAWVTFWVWS